MCSARELVKDIADNDFISYTCKCGRAGLLVRWSCEGGEATGDYSKCTDEHGDPGAYSNVVLLSGSRRFISMAGLSADRAAATDEQEVEASASPSSSSSFIIGIAAVGCACVRNMPRDGTLQDLISFHLNMNTFRQYRATTADSWAMGRGPRAFMHYIIIGIIPPSIILCSSELVGDRPEKEKRTRDLEIGAISIGSESERAERF